MIRRINTRKAMAIGAMGLLLGAAVIPATISAAELVTPATPTVKVTNPGNIVNDDSTFYDKYEWYGYGAGGQPTGFESGHYTKKLDLKAHYTFEVRNDTDKEVSFLPAVDVSGLDDAVYTTDVKGGTNYDYTGLPGWTNNNWETIPHRWDVEPHTTNKVTVPNLSDGLSDVKKGLYIYLYGLGKNDSTAGISYRIYQGDPKSKAYYIGNPGDTNREYIPMKQVPGSKRSQVPNEELTIALNSAMADADFLSGGASYEKKAIFTQKWLATVQHVTSNGTPLFVDDPMLSFLNKNYQYQNGTSSMATYCEPLITQSGTDSYLKIKLADVTVPNGAANLALTFHAKDGILKNDLTLNIPLKWQ